MIVNFKEVKAMQRLKLSILLNKKDSPSALTASYLLVSYIHFLCNALRTILKNASIYIYYPQYMVWHRLG
jgi:hypothetical protein